MVLAQAVFLFDPPNATTWFYLSTLLAVALFFKFSRLLSVRNLDVLTLPLLVPGLLLLRDPSIPDWVGYLWLLGGSLYFLVRCLLDLALVARPALAPNLTFGGLAWLAGALFVSLAAVAVGFRQPKDPAPAAANTPAPLDRLAQGGEQLVQQQPEVRAAAGADLSFWVGRTLAIACHLTVVLGLVFVGGWHFSSWHAGMAAATVYLLLPYTALDFAHWHHVWPMALVVWAVAAYRKPTVAGVLLGLAAATAYFPVVLLPLWVGFYWRRGAGRFAGACGLVGGLCLAVIACVLWIDDELARSVQSVLALPDWQAWREPIHGARGLWQDVPWAYRMPVFLVHAVLVIGTAFWPAPKNLAHLLALSAAVILGIQFWYADQGGTYVLWYLPLLTLLVFRPNLADRRPPLIAPETDWLGRLGRVLVRFGSWLLRPPPVPQRAR